MKIKIFIIDKMKRIIYNFILSGLKVYIYISFIILATLAGCTEVNLNTPDVINTNPPGAVTNVSVDNLNGKAKITYSLPSDKDLLYVKAVYYVKYEGDSTQRVVKASAYSNNLVVDGFADTLKSTVKLYAVNSSEVASEPVSLTVNPLTPPYLLAYRSLAVQAGFGGVYLTAKNISPNDLAIIPMVDTLGTGVWTQTPGLENVYTNVENIKHNFRNQPSVTRKYGFVVRDRWLHYSDTLIATITPLFEMKLDKTKFSVLQLPGDYIAYDPGWGAEMLFNDLLNEWGMWADGPVFRVPASAPCQFTIDMGDKHKFSRFNMFQWGEGQGAYYSFCPKKFEIFGSNNPPSDGSYANWVSLGAFEIIQPSGGAIPETAQDTEAAKNGWEFDFPAGSDSYQYFRFKVLRAFNGTYLCAFSELTLYGD
jgi:hypothetical protein